MNEETIISQSHLGKRLDKVIRNEKRAIRYKGQKFPIVGQITIGRDPESTFVIENKLASRNHAVIQKIKEAFFLKDLKSTNGTFINGHKLPEEKYVKLNPGDVITVGKTELIFM